MQHGCSQNADPREVLHNNMLVVLRASALLARKNARLPEESDDGQTGRNT